MGGDECQPSTVNGGKPADGHKRHAQARRWAARSALAIASPFDDEDAPTSPPTTEGIEAPTGVEANLEGFSASFPLPAKNESSAEVAMARFAQPATRARARAKELKNGNEHPTDWAAELDDPPARVVGQPHDAGLRSSDRFDR